MWRVRITIDAATLMIGDIIMIFLHADHHGPRHGAIDDILLLQIGPSELHLAAHHRIMIIAVQCLLVHLFKAILTRTLAHVRVLLMII
jgi:hypothetical protein